MSLINQIVFGTRDSVGYILPEHEYAVKVGQDPDWAIRKCSDCEAATPQTVLNLFSINAREEVAGMRVIYVCTKCGSFRVATS